MFWGHMQVVMSNCGCMSSLPILSLLSARCMLATSCRCTRVSPYLRYVAVLWRMSALAPAYLTLQEPLEPYRLGYLAGLEVCISGYSRQKAQLSNIIQAGGGRYMAQMNKQSCRMLVAEATDSIKAT